jgi:hypothetical protein
MWSFWLLLVVVGVVQDTVAEVALEDCLQVFLV